MLRGLVDPDSVEERFSHLREEQQDPDVASARYDMRGWAALDGRRAEAIAGYRTALTGWRDLGLPWDESVTALMFVTLIGADDPDAHAAGLAAQVILRRLGAVRVLAMLDPLLDTAADAAQVAAHADRA